LLIECILFFSDCVDAVEVVHVADGARASSRVGIELTVPHWADTFTEIPSMIAGAVIIDLRYTVAICGTTTVVGLL